MEKNFQIKIIRPSGVYYQNSIIELVFPAYDGLRAILYNHAPFICLAGKGIIRLLKGDNVYEYFYMQNGILSVQNNEVSILTESILAPKDVDYQKVEQELQRCQDSSITQQYSCEQRTNDIQHCKFQLELRDLSNSVSSAV